MTELRLTHASPAIIGQAVEFAADFADRFGRDALHAAMMLREHMAQHGTPDRAEIYVEVIRILRESGAYNL